MHGTSRFQSSRLRGYGNGAAASDANKQASTKKGLSLSNEQFDSIISGITDIGKTAITTVGGIETARITGKAPTTSGTLLPSPGRGTISGGGGGGGGGSGISGTALAVGGLVVVGLGVGAYFVFRRK